jgi:hypothetical protein
VAAVVVAAAAISGCAGFWDPLPNSGGGGTTGPASGTFYVINQKTSQLAGFSFASGASSPTPVSGSPYAVSAPLAMAIAPSGSYLYVSTAAGITYYVINSDGSLSAGTQAVSGDQATAMQVDPTGSWLIYCISGNSGLYAVPLDTGTGAASGSVVTAPIQLPGTTPKAIAISPTGSTNPYVFVAVGTSGFAAVGFSSGSSNPFASQRSYAVRNSFGADNTVAVDPQNRLVYVGETTAASGSQSGGVRVFTIGSSFATEITTGTSDSSGTAYPYSTGGTGPSSIVATANYVYVANSAVSGSSNGNITGFSLATSVAATSFTLKLINTISSGPLTYGIAEDSTDAYLLAVNFGGSPDLSTFTFDTTTAGKLDAGPTAALGTDPTGSFAIVAAP